jgi:hypothetical protein
MESLYLLVVWPAIDPKIGVFPIWEGVLEKQQVQDVD